MTNSQAVQHDTARESWRPDGGYAWKPKAIGLVRAEVSGAAAPRHALEIRRHAEQLGYRYLYTVRPPAHPGTDPIGYGLTIATGVHAAALIVYDLATVDNTPAHVCDTCDLETVCPPMTWTRAIPGRVTPEHAHPGHPLTVAESHRIMQHHIACRAATCPRKAVAFRCLARAGALVPPAMSPRERVAARGMAFEPAGGAVAGWGGPDLPTLLAVLDALTDSHSDARVRPSRLAPDSRR